MKICYSFFLILAFSLIFSGSVDAKIASHNEYFRPQFHFSPLKGNLGSGFDLVELSDQYYLFYPVAAEGDSLFHIYEANSKDLLHWNYSDKKISLENAKDIPGGGSISGVSALVDSTNFSGLAKDGNKVLLLFYSSNDGKQYLIYSTNKGKSWQAYSNEPLIKSNSDDQGRFLQVFWYAPAKKFYLILETQSDKAGNFCFYSSSDLKSWTLEDKLVGFSGQPDFFQLPIERHVDDKKWVLTEGNGSYLIGDFDGHHFQIQGHEKHLDTSSYLGDPVTCKTNQKKTIQIARLKGFNTTGRSFSGQLTFPVSLYLQRVDSGYQVLRTPVKSIHQLVYKSYSIKNKTVIPGLTRSPVRTIKGDCLMIKGNFDLKNVNSFGFMVRTDRSGNGTEIRYDATKSILSCMTQEVKLAKEDIQKMELTVLIDRTSIEIFMDGGKYSLRVPFAPEIMSDRLIFYNTGGEIRIEDMSITQLTSVFQTY